MGAVGKQARCIREWADSTSTREESASSTAEGTCNREVVDSDEEFKDDEPRLDISPLQQAAVAAHVAFCTVRDRFAAEKALMRSESARVGRAQKAEMRRNQRREELISSINADILDTSLSSSSSSSSLSSSSAAVVTPKRKFAAAAVTEAYTSFLAASAQRAAVQAAEMKAAIDKEAQRAERDAQLTAEYREKKLASVDAFRQSVLNELRRGKENNNPNSRDDEKESGRGGRGLLSSFMGL